ncbi:MAG TPA: MFS transporter [Ignavibacteriaceae bacterium]|nr:MFS transporter [Ignavibacteriaceae bacterium]HRQ55140.1 MFS transporter [Ignavibacteriaceae bacterium]
MWICQFLAMVGMSSIVPFLPLFVRELGVTSIQETSKWSGLVFAGPFFVSLFLSSLWGNLGDKYGRKLMTIRATFGLAIAQIIIGFSTDINQLFIGRLLQGGLSGFLPAAMALIASNTPEEKTGYALGILQSSTAAGTVLGPLFGGLISDFLSFRAVFFVVAGLLALVGFAIIFFVKEEKRDESKETISIIDNWKYVLSNKKFLIPSILIMLTSLGISFVRPIFVLFVETLEINQNYLPTITGALYSIVGVFSVFSAYWWGKRSEKIGLKKSVVIASIITGLMYLLHSVIINPYYLIPVRTLLGFGYGALMPLLFTRISNNVAKERRGGVMGVGSSFQVMGNLIGPLFGGYAGAVIGFPFSFAITGAIFLVISIGAFFNLND